MIRTKLHALADLGQSIWLDMLSRSLLTSGGLKEYVEKGLRGETSNPAIFEKAIAETNDYDDELRRLALQGKTALESYETLVVEDIQRAADILKPVFEESLGGDGYISLEVNPHLAHDIQGTLEAVRRYHRLVDRPNLMIKVPATSEGILAIETLISEGININVTLMFSLAQYDLVAEAYLKGLEQRASKVYALNPIASVASFFVSRVDIKVDPLLEKIQSPKARAIKGKIGIANAKMAYQRFRDTYRGERWDRLRTKGARVQRVLYGSTSTKNPAYPDTLYPDHLIGPQTVNTLPPETLEAFLDHGTVALTLESDLDEAHAQLKQLADLGIDLSDITNQLLDEGVQKFNTPFDKLIKTITEKQAAWITA